MLRDVLQSVTFAHNYILPSTEFQVEQKFSLTNMNNCQVFGIRAKGLSSLSENRGTKSPCDFLFRMQYQDSIRPFIHGTDKATAESCGDGCVFCDK